MLRVLSLGAGVQSSTMALMYKHGELSPMPDCAIFADTQGEPKAVYEWLDWLEAQLPFPIHRVSRGELWKSVVDVRTTRDGQRKYIKTAIPVHTADGLERGMGQRQCTRDYKIEPINHKIRELLGVRSVRRTSPVLATVAIGISMDEFDRAANNYLPWIQSHWPLIDMGMDRDDCKDWMLAKGYPEPPRSACTFCPFHSDNEWLALTKDEFADAVEKERELQAAYVATAALDSVPYLHASRVPLDQVRLVPSQPARQLNMFRNSCGGFCGV